MDEEIWKDIVGYEGLYRISSLGRVESLYGNSRILKHRIDSGGYPTVFLYKNAKRKTFSVHRIEAIAFWGYRKGLLVRHLNDIKNDNRLENLAWGTNRDNFIDIYRNGNGRVLKSEDVKNVQKMLAKQMPLYEIAYRFKVSEMTIRDIKKGRHFAWLKES